MKPGLYWSDYHQQFYHYNGKHLFKFWRYTAERFKMVDGYTRSDYSIVEFKVFNPIYLGEF